MNERTPDFSELIGEDVSVEERARLEQMHQMIVDSGPLPELPLALQNAPAVEDPHDSSVAFSFLPRRGGRILTLAAGFALLCLIVGYVIGNHRSGFTTDFTVAMARDARGAAGQRRAQGGQDRLGRQLAARAPGRGPQAAAEGRLVHALPHEEQEAAVSCGTFRVHERDDDRAHERALQLQGSFDGWVVSAGKTRPAAARRVPDR